MIQRIQSVYLLISSILSGGLIFVFNLWDNNEEKVFTIDLLESDLFNLKIIPKLKL